MNTLPIILGPADNRHCRQIIDLILPIQQIEFNVPVTLEGQPDLLDIEANYQATGGGFWIARHDSPQPILGTIGLIAIGHQAGAIRKMFVRKEYRGKEWGIAGQLLDTLLAHSRETGIRDLYLGTVEVLKAAHRFYERNGFQRIDKAALPDYFPRMASDNVFYHLSIRPI